MCDIGLAADRMTGRRGGEPMTNTTTSERVQTKGQGAERRRAQRFPASAIPDLKSVQLSGTETEVELVNVSRGGALLEGMTRLTPRSPISIRIVAGGHNFLLRGKVLRSEVCGYSGAKLKYQTALCFDEEFSLLPADQTEPVRLTADIVDLQPPPPAYAAEAGDPAPAAKPDLGPPDDLDLESNFTAYCASYEELRHFLNANNW